MPNKISFDENTHTYFNSKMEIIPSVSKLIQYEFPNMYKGVPADILKNKANYGTTVHDLIEQFEKGELSKRLSSLEDNLKNAIKGYCELKKKYKFKVASMEEIISYQDRYAGRYDILTDKGLLMDIKTTSTLHTDWLACQLGLYYLALGIEQDIGYCIWLPKDKEAQFKEIEVWSKHRCLDLLTRYEDAQVDYEYDFY